MLHSHITEDFENMIINILSDDPLQVFIRGHLIIESKLIRLIESSLVNKNEIDVAKLNFPMKVDLAYALGAIEDKSIKNVLLGINSFRNKFAHNIDYKITDVDMKKMVKGKSNFERFLRGLYLKDDEYNDFDKFKVLFTMLCRALDEEEKRIEMSY
ncbi:hypothetical protein ACTNEO_19890 [Gracilibacillus sp. HCP3S3_G5_1]|uniref:hypothetical protein n=1 Tax=unclassified Gracilibacillus TaxID=2625209 RepID=UPI003F8873F2